MKCRIAIRPAPCKQRPTALIVLLIYPDGKVIFSLSPLALSSLPLLSLAWRGADAHAVTVVGVVVVAVAVVVDITKRRRRARIAHAQKLQPRTRIIENNLYRKNITQTLGIALYHSAVIRKVIHLPFPLDH